MRNKIVAGAAIGVFAAVGVAMPAQAISATTADLYVLHAVPDLPVDVYVNGALTLDDFQPGDLAGPLDLPAGVYTVAITAADAADDSAPAIGPIDSPSRRARATRPWLTWPRTVHPRRPCSPTT